MQQVHGLLHIQAIELCAKALPKLVSKCHTSQQVRDLLRIQDLRSVIIPQPSNCMAARTATVPLHPFDEYGLRFGKSRSGMAIGLGKHMTVKQEDQVNNLEDE